MQDSTITGDATVGGSVQLANAEVSGTLHVASSQLDLRQARLGALDLQWPATTSLVNNSFHGSSLSIQGGSIQSGSGMIVRGSRVSVTGRDNQTHISVGPDSVTTLNGMTVRGSGDQTTVITREGWVYVNGKKVSGSGPETYAGYRVAIPSAPVIEGPGWTEGSPTADASGIPATKPQEAVLQTVTLGEGTVVRGNITFGSGQGQVKVLPGAQFTGQVVGGKLVKS
jgi:hypothetical protein